MRAQRMRRFRTLLLNALFALCGSLSLSPACEAHLVVIVSHKSPVKALTKSEVADIYLARTAQLPGGAEAIPLDQADTGANRDEFYEIVTGKSSAQLRAYWSKLIFTGSAQPPRVFNDIGALKRFVADHPNALGYIDEQELDSSVKAVLLLR